MDRTNYCADCEQHAREAATLRAQLAAKDEEIEEYKGLLSSEECDTTFWKERCEAKDKVFDEMTDRFVEEKDAAEARVKELEDLLNEANKLIMEHCDQADRIAALESELAEAKKDTARMDWIDENVLSLPMSANNSDDIEWVVIGQLRVHIDDARKAD